ncbi:pyruvate kinase [Intrasporangium mesophilum]
MTTPDDALSSTLDAVVQLRLAVEGARLAGPAGGSIHPNHRAGAENLARYLEVRRRDIRELQDALSRLGLSSLGRLEPDVLGTVRAVEAALRAMSPQPQGYAVPPGSDEATRGAALVGLDRLELARASIDLLGPPTPGRATRIMVTLPSEAAESPTLIDALVDRGAELLRINCAHDGPQQWASMVGKVRHAERRVRRPITVVMDLAGPKLRTGPIEAGPPVLKVRPTRDPLGRVVEPARVWVTTTDGPASDGAARLPVTDPGWLQMLAVGDRIGLVDARGRRRTLDIVTVRGDGAMATAERTCYLVPGLELRTRDGMATSVDVLPSREQKLFVRPDDVIDLVPDLTPAQADSRPLRIGCTLPQVFQDVAPGDRIWFDDGKIGGTVERADADVVSVRVTEAGPTGARLGAGKGINLPDTQLDVPALTGEDRANLAFVAAHADIVSLSFVREPGDVRMLQQELHSLGADGLGIILKIETVSGFANLPSILAEALVSKDVGVMIARGDLAVEAGYERLAEVQEEILWLCEAAHVPVIWATQVLDTLARTGRPSRAEVTDAAMSGRAECVMLNKGPYITHAVELLDDILQRMSGHHDKKRTLMRHLRSWDDAFMTSQGGRTD